MSTFRLTRFAQPDALKSIAPERLILFLRPYSAYLESRGFALPIDGGEIDYDTLVMVLMTPDEHVPREMVNPLFFVNEASHPDAFDRLLAKAAARGIDLDLGDGPTPADAAVAAWLADHDLLEELHAETAVFRPKSFEYYLGRSRRPRPFPPCERQRAVEIAARLDLWFVDNKRGSDSRVLVLPQGAKTYVLIRHGATMRREGSIHEGKRDVAYYRPEVHDVLVYDSSTGVIGLKAGTMGEKKLYRDVFGAMLFGDDEYFSVQFGLSLQPLLDHGPEILACDDVPGMQSVKLVEVRRNRGGPYKYREISQATDLFGVFGDSWRERLTFGKLSGATFEVTLGEGKAQRGRKVAIVPPNLAKYDRDEDADVIETWLKRRGFMPSPAGDADVDTDADAALAGPGIAARSGDGSSGLDQPHG